MGCQSIKVIDRALERLWTLPEPLDGSQFRAKPFGGNQIQASLTELHRDPCGMVVQQALQHGPFGIGREPVKGVGIREELVSIRRSVRSSAPHGASTSSPGQREGSVSGDVSPTPR